MNETPGKKHSNIVLIIDDETANIIALTDILSPEYDVFAAKNGPDAIALAEKHSPDVILLDVLMPEMDGYEVISTLKNMEKTRDIPVIFITGLDNIDAEKKGLSLGAADYIPKPFSPDIVKLRVQIQIKLVNHIRTIKERDEMERQLNIIRDLEAGLIAAKEQAEHNREIAEHSNRAKSEFLSRMSHEMRTPMNAIMGLLQLVKMHGVPDASKEYIDEIDENSAKLLELIDNVLDISGMEYGVFKLAHEPFRVISMFREELEIAKFNTSQRNQSFTSTLDPSIPPVLIGDFKHLKQVMGNLLANAVKFTPELGNISLNALLLQSDSKKATLQISVEDDGIGISEEHQKSLFTIFEQADGSSTRKHGGIGIGLALSKRIVEKMGGDIRVESEPGKGSKFTFTCVLDIP